MAEEKSEKKSRRYSLIVIKFLVYHSSLWMKGEFFNVLNYLKCQKKTCNKIGENNLRKI